MPGGRFDSPPTAKIMQLALAGADQCRCRLRLARRCRHPQRRRRGHSIAPDWYQGIANTIVQSIRIHQPGLIGSVFAGNDVAREGAINNTPPRRRAWKEIL
jgi:hypothetical protein